MSATLFPLVQGGPAMATAGDLPICREVKWDYGRNKPVFRRGEPVIVEGVEAVYAWAWLALHTPRFRHEMFSRAYGSELEGLIGQPYTEDLKLSEGRRYVAECLEINPYIKNVDNVTVAFADGVLSIDCTLVTVYGRKELTASV